MTASNVARPPLSLSKSVFSNIAIIVVIICTFRISYNPRPLPLAARVVETQQPSPAQSPVPCAPVRQPDRSHHVNDNASSYYPIDQHQILRPVMATPRSNDVLRPRERVAVCICGTARTFHYQAMHNHILETFIQPLKRNYDTDVFFIVRFEDDSGSNSNPVATNESATHAAIAKFNPARVITYSGLEGLDNYEYIANRFVEKQPGVPCQIRAPASCGFNSSHTKHESGSKVLLERLDFSHTLYRTKQCMQTIINHENRNNIKYDWVYRLRPDVALVQAETLMPSDLSRDILYLTTSPWDKTFEAWYPTYARDDFLGYGNVGDQLFVASRRVAAIAFSAFDVVDDCDAYHMPHGNMEAYFRYYLMKHRVPYHLPKWTWIIVRGDRQPTCRALMSIEVPGTTWEEREKACIDWVMSTKGEVRIWHGEGHPINDI